MKFLIINFVNHFLTFYLIDQNIHLNIVSLNTVNLWRVLSSDTWHRVVWQMFPDISEDFTASVFRIAY
jgi:hypothetical protein